MKEEKVALWLCWRSSSSSSHPWIPFVLLSHHVDYRFSSQGAPICWPFSIPSSPGSGLPLRYFFDKQAERTAVLDKLPEVHTYRCHFSAPNFTFSLAVDKIPLDLSPQRSCKWLPAWERGSGWTPPHSEAQGMRRGWRGTEEEEEEEETLGWQCHSTVQKRVWFPFIFILLISFHVCSGCTF